MVVKTLLTCVFLIMPIFLKAQFKDKDILVSCGVGYSKSSSYKGISSDNQLNIYLIIKNIYFDCAFNFESSEERQYGSGGVSDKHRLTNFNLGYSLPIFKKYVYIMPLLGWGINETLYNDRYYDSDIASRQSSFCYGGNLALTYKHIIAIIKITNEQKGVSIGFNL